MILYDEEEKREKTKKEKRMKIILIISITFIVLIIIALAVLLVYLLNNPSEVTITVDGSEQAELVDLIQVTTLEDGSIQITAPIKDIAAYLGYESFNGDYTTISEDTDSCYVQNDNEVAIFNLDSNIIYKIDLTKEETEYEYCEIDENVFMQDDKLYTNAQGLEKAFNISMSYNEKKKTLTIYTLDSLITIATEKAIDYGYANLDETFVNYKTLLEGMMVVVTDEDEEDGKCGVIDYSTGETILGIKYDTITYIPQKSAFIVEADEKVGIISSSGETMIESEYESLKLIDEEDELYLAQSNGLYGVVNIYGETIIYLEYEQIGVDIEEFERSDLKTGYILLDTLIPVMQDDKWGFFDKEGNQVIDLKYDGVGCLTSQNENISYNLLLIPDKKYIVVMSDDLYGLINLKGEPKVDCKCEDMYMRYSSGEAEYYMVYKEKSYNILDEIE